MDFFVFILLFVLAGGLIYLSIKFRQFEHTQEQKPEEPERNYEIMRVPERFNQSTESSRIIELENELDNISRRLDLSLDFGVPDRPTKKERVVLEEKYEKLMKEMVDQLAKEADVKFINDSLSGS